MRLKLKRENRILNSFITFFVKLVEVLFFLLLILYSRLNPDIQIAAVRKNVMNNHVIEKRSSQLGTDPRK